MQYYAIQWTVVECCPFQHTSTDSHGVLSEREKGSPDLLVMVYGNWLCERFIEKFQTKKLKRIFTLIIEQVKTSKCFVQPK